MDQNVDKGNLPNFYLVEEQEKIVHFIEVAFERIWMILVILRKEIPFLTGKKFQSQSIL